MKIKQIAHICGDQDGAIFENLLFRFGSRGRCRVYDLTELMHPTDAVAEIEPISSFILDKADVIVPHSNAVVFGTEYFCDGERFPLLYSNVYNNYAKEGDRRVGVLCVYRITEECGEFSSELVQIIRIGFTDDELWRSVDVTDVRPYGNFVIDREGARLYAFVMRDGDKKTRYFSFDLPKSEDGVKDPTNGIRTVTLTKSDILGYFDAPYHRFIQGACMRGGLIYSTEGFGKDIHPAIRIIDTVSEREIFHTDLFDGGYEHEAEFIDFLGDKCLYGDARGNLFEFLPFD